jgi:putative cell wall-binding protein
MVLASAGPGSAQSSVRVQRIGGADRFETAVDTVLEAHYDHCADDWETFYGSEEECRDEGDLGGWTLARGDSFADALSAASVYVGPTLITPREQLPAAFERLERRLSNQAIIVGQDDVIDESVEEALVPRFARTVGRAAGPTRYDTAVAVARLHRDGYGDSGSTFHGVVIVNGENWPDAFAASSLTDILHVVLPTHRDQLPEVIGDYLAESTGSRTVVTVVGGTAAVSDAVVAQIDEATNGTIRRVGGTNRFETARAVAGVYFDERGVRPLYSDPEAERRFGVILVRPDTYADAITAPNITRTRGAPILLAATNDELGEDNANWLAEHAEQITSITALGTDEVLADRVLDQAEGAVCDARGDC